MYCLMDAEDYIKYSNEEKLTIVQIEDIEAYEQLEEIAAVPGIDMLFFGPADFSQSIGMPTNIGNEKTMEAKRRVAEVARKHGKFAGTVGGPGNMRELYDMGYRLINMGADVVGLSIYYKDIMDKVTEFRKELYVNKKPQVSCGFLVLISIKQPQVTLWV
jgi:4-hydroxy-2-oxoheptanedioate aldolase